MLFSYSLCYIYTADCRCGPDCKCASDCKGQCCPCCCKGDGSACTCGPDCKCAKGCCPAQCTKCSKSLFSYLLASFCLSTTSLPPWSSLSFSLSHCCCPTRNCLIFSLSLSLYLSLLGPLFSLIAVVQLEIALLFPSLFSLSILLSLSLSLLHSRL